MRIRNQIFWTMDLLRMGRMGRPVSEINEILFKPFGPEAIRYRKEHLRSILQHAASSTAFYARLDGTEDLQEFPVVNKQLLRDDTEAFLSSRHKRTDMTRVSTSGSTGTPFSVYQCTAKRRRNQADNLSMSGLGNYEVGDPFYYLRIWTSANRKSTFSNLLTNTRPIDVSDLSDAAMKSVFRSIDRMKNGGVILAYGSTYEVLARYMQSADLRTRAQPKALFVMSEPLDTGTRNFLSHRFGCPVLCRYSNAENGFLGHQWTMDSTDYLINSASYSIEFLDLENDRPADAGQPGRVVVTDLFSFGMPMIRYDTGDVATSGEALIGGNRVPVFKTIEGRRLDFIRGTNGELVSPHAIDYAVRNSPGLLQFQLIQETQKGYLLKVIVDRRGSGTEAHLTAQLQDCLGPDAMVRIEHVDEIPVLASGKRKLVVNAFEPDTRP